MGERFISNTPAGGLADPSDIASKVLTGRTSAGRAPGPAEPGGLPKAIPADQAPIAPALVLGALRTVYSWLRFSSA